MRALSEIRESPNYEQLKTSVEAKSCAQECLVSIFFLIVFAIPLFIGENTSKTFMLWLMELFGFLPLFLYTLYKLIEIFLWIDCYSFTEVVLDRPQQGYKGAMYFTVILRDRQGRELEVDTRQIFSRSSPSFEDYVNQRALIGYNDKTERVVVVKKLP